MPDRGFSGYTVETVVRVYCAGPSHNHHVILFDGHVTPERVEGVIRADGFRQSKDGRWWCQDHRALMHHANAAVKQEGDDDA